MMVLLLVTLKGRLLFSWTPWWAISEVMQVFGRKLEGVITNRWAEGLMDAIG
jgi:cyanate lyase